MDLGIGADCGLRFLPKARSASETRSPSFRNRRGNHVCLGAITRSFRAITDPRIIAENWIWSAGVGMSRVSSSEISKRSMISSPEAALFAANNGNYPFVARDFHCQMPHLRRQGPDSARFLRDTFGVTF